MFRHLFHITLAPLLLPALAFARPVPVELFADHAVLQRDKPIPVWGRATPGEKLTVSFGGASHSATTDEQGRWQVVLKPRPASAKPEDLVMQGEGAPVVVKDVLVGEVWLASGQSNMDMSVNSCNDSAVEIAAASFPQIRFFKLPQVSALQPKDTVTGSWKVCSPSTVGAFSGVGYFFARDLHQKLGVPVGVVQSAWGGTAVLPWTSRETLNSVPELKDVADSRIAAYQKSVRDDAKPMLAQWIPSLLFNGMIAPLVPYSIRGAIWYQGESDADHAKDADQYGTVFPLLIRDWRRHWGQDFPFYFVQLPNWIGQNGNTNWPVLREAQFQTMKQMPQTGMAVALDVGEANDVHPHNKQDVGKRLALLARAKTYGEKGLVWQSPFYQSSKVTSGKIRVQFDTGGSPLMVGKKNGLDPVQPAPGAKLEWFEIAGADGTFVPADALIDGDNAVVVSSPQVPTPTQARYAWAQNPEGCNLYNQAGLPAAPFHTGMTEETLKR